MSKDSNISSVLLQELVSSGEFYEYIMANFQGKYNAGGIDRFGDRPATKKEVMRIMYFDTKNEKAPFYAPFKLFAQLFPIEARIMKLIKSCGGKNGYKQFPVLLQRLESKLMLEKVGQRMPEDIPFLTIHDSLILPANAVPDAVKLIEQRFNFYLDMTPKISPPEILTPEKGFEALDGYVQEKLTNLEIRFNSKQNVTRDNVMDDDGMMEE